MEQEGFRPAVKFSHADAVVSRFSLVDSGVVTGFTVFYNGGAGLSDVGAAEAFIKEGKSVEIVAKNISKEFARDFVEVGAAMKLIVFNPRAIEIHNLVLDGIQVHAVFNGAAGYSQVVDLKTEAEAARKKGGKGSVTVYVVGNLGWGRKADVRRAGGYAVGLEELKNHGGASSVLSYAIG